jgi:hypothetical protein
MINNGMCTRLFYVCTACLLYSTQLFAFDIPERRRDQFSHDFGYYIYPIAGDIPGLGTAAGLGATVINIADSDTDFTAFKIEGDFSASGYALLNLNAIEKRLIFDTGYYDYDVAPVVYRRGIDSDPNDYILPRANGSYFIGQATLSFDERRIETYYRLISGTQQLTEVRDKEGVAFSSIDNSTYDAVSQSLGITLDYTDDHLDPRRGLRFQTVAKIPKINDPLASKYYTLDYNLTGYIPFRKYDTLVYNFFLSNAYVTDKGVTDYATLKTQDGLECGSIPPGPEQDSCLATENKFINDQILSNEYGTATPLGGTQRLRSFANGRYYAGNSLEYGLEYRWNLTDERTPFDLIIAKGIRTGIQLAAFYEAGTVNDNRSELFSSYKHSYGMGLRIVLDGLIIRADYATGSEGDEFQLFLDYPWNLYSIDNPG